MNSSIEKYESIVKSIIKNPDSIIAEHYTDSHTDVFGERYEYIKISFNSTGNERYIAYAPKNSVIEISDGHMDWGYDRQLIIYKYVSSEAPNPAKESEIAEYKDLLCQNNRTTKYPHIFYNRLNAFYASIAKSVEVHILAPDDISNIQVAGLIYNIDMITENKEIKSNRFLAYVRPTPFEL